MIEVYVDSEAGVGLDECAEVSRELDFLIETEDLIKGRYHLNVSSPGADRPLTEARHFRKHVGRPLAVTVGEGDGRRTLTGTLQAAHDDAFELDVNGQTERLPYDAVEDARVQLPW